MRLKKHLTNHAFIHLCIVLTHMRLCKMHFLTYHSRTLNSCIYQYIERWLHLCTFFNATPSNWWIVNRKKTYERCNRMKTKCFFIRIHSNAIRSNRPTNQPASQQTCICRVPLARTASGATCLLSKYKTSTIVMGCACVCLCVFFCDSFHSILFFYLYSELLIRLQIQSHTI